MLSISSNLHFDLSVDKLTAFNCALVEYATRSAVYAQSTIGCCIAAREPFVAPALAGCFIRLLSAQVRYYKLQRAKWL